jgi:PKD repeat protein
MKKIYMLLTSCFLASGAFAQSFTAMFPFTDVTTTSGTTDPTPVPSVTGLTFSSFSAVGTPANPNAGGRFTFTDWSLGATHGSNSYAGLTGGIVLSEYYEVTVAPASGYTMTLNDIAFRIQRSSTGIRTYAVRSSVDGYATNLPASISPANPNLSVQSGDVFFYNFDSLSSGQNGSMITLGGSSYTNISSPVTFRFYGFNAEASGGTFSIDEVTFTGSVTAPAALDAMFSSSNACEGLATMFTDLSTGPDNIVSWSWDFGDGQTSNMQNPTNFYAAPGAYTVTLTVTDDQSATDMTTATVTVHPTPLAAFLTSSSTACSGESVVFSDVSTISAGTISSYMWNFGDPASGSANTSTLSSTSHTFVSPMTYSVMHSVTSDMGCSDTTTSTVTVDSVYGDLPYTQAGNTVMFNGSGFGGVSPYSYSLNPGDGSPTLTDPMATHTYTTPGIYNACLTVTDMNGCADVVCETITVISIGISNQSAASVSISPNPTLNGLVNVSLPQADNTILSVFNILGEKVMEKQINQTTSVIDLSSQPNGSYYFSIRSGSENITRRVIISK